MQIFPYFNRVSPYGINIIVPTDIKWYLDERYAYERYPDSAYLYHGDSYIYIYDSSQKFSVRWTYDTSTGVLESQLISYSGDTLWEMELQTGVFSNPLLLVLILGIAGVVAISLIYIYTVMKKKNQKLKVK